MQTQQKEASKDLTTADNQDGPLAVAHAASSPFRNRLWRQLANIKFKALYACECARVSGKRARLSAFTLAVISGSSVASWAIWQNHATIWATIIATGQVMQIAILYIPFLKNENEFLKASFEFETLYLKYEQLWYDLEDGTINETAAKAVLRELRAKALEIERTNPVFPEKKRWINRIRSRAISDLELDFL